ncbi:hypothetical protein MTO96_013535 [Rhipicephalus appendiculatus]
MPVVLSFGRTPRSVSLLVIIISGAIIADIAVTLTSRLLGWEACVAVDLVGVSEEAFEKRRAHLKTALLQKRAASFGRVLETPTSSGRDVMGNWKMQALASESSSSSPDPRLRAPHVEHRARSPSQSKPSRNRMEQLMVSTSVAHCPTTNPVSSVC